jgi:hypothetical protein
MRMRIVVVVAAAGLSTSCLTTSGKLTAAQAGERFAQTKPACEQVISCGTKNGTVKEYPTPCDARDDGATNIHPKPPGGCEATK